MAETTTITKPAPIIEGSLTAFLKSIDKLGAGAIPDTFTGIDTSVYAPKVAARTQAQTDALAAATAPAMAGLVGPDAYKDFMSPYQQQVIDTTLAEFDRQRAIQEKSLAGQAIASGAFGGGREGVQRAEFGTQSARDRAALEAQLRQQGFQQAMSARQQDIANRFGLGQAQLGLGTFQTGLASQVPQLQRADISTLGQVGAAQQAQAQAELDAQRQAARTAAYEPLERLGFFGQGVTGLLGGYPAQYQFTSTPPASPLQTALGLGTGLAGIFGALR